MSTPFIPGFISGHLGGLHPLEQAMVYLLAFGPFLLLGFVLWYTRHHGPDVDADEDED